MALNAATEAARAGEQGRGFAAMNKNVESVSGIAENLVEKVEAGSEQVKEFDQGINNISGLVVSSVKDVQALSYRVFISLAKIDHLLIKSSTYLSVNKAAPAYTWVDHTKCRLGQWYYEGEGNEFFSSSRTFAALETPHVDLHKNTKAVFSCIDEPELDIKNVKEYLDGMEQAGIKIFSYLDALL